VGGWLAATFKSYDVAITLDRSGAKGRLHHFTYFMDSREDVLKAAAILGASFEGTDLGAPSALRSGPTMRAASAATRKSSSPKHSSGFTPTVIKAF
jgi:hypothetical protein